VVTDLRKNIGSKYNFEQIYSSLGKTRQMYFQALERTSFSDKLESAILTIVRNWRINHPKMGSRVMYKSLQLAGIELSIGITKFEQLLSKHNLTVKKYKRSFPKTTDSSNSNKAYPNLTNGLKINGINQLIVADITYIYICSKWHYLFIFKDAYSQLILSIIPSTNMYASNCQQAIQQIVALRGEQNLKNTILHSDNGKQFDAKLFKAQIVDELNMKISRAKTSQQNGSAEQLNHIVKNMYLNNWQIDSFEELIIACNRFKYLSNHQRAIEQLGYKTPIGFEKELLQQSEKKKVKKQFYDFSK